MPEIPPLPPHDEWRKVFPSLGPLRERVSIANPETADRIARNILTGDRLSAGENKIIIESFPGPGCLSRALLKLPHSTVKKLIILEDSPAYLEALKPLEADPRVKVVPQSGYVWDTYQYLEEHGYLDDIETVPWANVHPQLHFISHIPHTIKGEQLIAQFFRMIPDRLWLFKYGRVPMSFILGKWVWERLTAPQGTSARCKVGVIAQATAHLEDAVPPKSLLPYDDHFHPKTINPYYRENRPESRRLGHPVVAANVVPYENQIIAPGKLEEWDYVLRRLFVLKASTLEKSLSSLSSGAGVLKKVLNDPLLPENEQVELSKTIKQLSMADWALIMRAFSNWPFKPSDLLISDGFKFKERL